MTKKKILLMALIAVALTVALALGGCSSKKEEPAPAEEETAPVEEEAAAADETAPATDESMDYLVLVNKEYQLPENWEKELELTTVKNSVGDDVQVECAAYEAYLQMKEEIEAEPELADRDVKLELDSAFRSVADQQKIWDEFTEKYGEDYVRKYVAVPGFSEHHTGLALDLYFTIAGKDIYENEDLVEYPEIWEVIHKHLADHGFILRYPKKKEAVSGYKYEPWHIRYVGSAEIAHEITDKELTLEEYLDKLPKTDVTPAE